MGNWSHLGKNQEKEPDAGISSYLQYDANGNQAVVRLISSWLHMKLEDQPTVYLQSLAAILVAAQSAEKSVSARLRWPKELRLCFNVYVLMKVKLRSRCLDPVVPVTRFQWTLCSLQAHLKSVVTNFGTKMDINIDIRISFIVNFISRDFYRTLRLIWWFWAPHSSTLLKCTLGWHQPES